MLIIGQDPSSDETLAGRIFVGTAGQIAQNLLTRLGLTRSYLMFNTFLFGVQSSSITPTLESDSTIVNYRNSLFDQAKATNPGVHRDVRHACGDQRDQLAGQRNSSGGQFYASDLAERRGGELEQSLCRSARRDYGGRRRHCHFDSLQYDGCDADY